MKNAVLLNKARKRKRKRKSSPRQKAYRNLVKKLGSVKKAAAAWNKRKKKRRKASANTTKRKKKRTTRRKTKKRKVSRKKGKKRRKVSRNTAKRRRPSKKRRRSSNKMTKRGIASVVKGMRRAGMPKSYIKRVKSGLVSANKVAMSKPWKKRYKAGVRRKKSRGRGKFSLARWKAGSLAAYNPLKIKGLKNMTVNALKIGVPVVTAGLAGYMVPFWLMQKYPQYVNTMWKRHAIAGATAVAAGGAVLMLPRLLKKKSSMPLATATAMSVAAGYLVATVGPKLMAKVLPAVPGAGTAGFGQDPAIAAAIQRGIEEGVRDEGLGYTEEEVVGVETLGYTQAEVRSAPRLGEFGLAMKGRF